MHQRYYKLQFVILSLILTTCSASAFAQQKASASSATLDWETLSPEGEEFTVQMPKGSTLESSKEPYHKMELNTRTYLSKGQPGPVFAVVSLSGIKSNPALYTEMQRMNSYVDAFKTLFAPKIRKDTIAKLVLVGDKTLQGNLGREYRMTIGDLSGTAQVFATRKRFYSLVYLNTKKDDSLQEQFVSSFMLPEKSAQPAATAAATGAPTIQAPAAEPAEARLSKLSEAAPAADQPAADVKVEPSGDASKRGPISGGVLNGKAISLPRPDYPADAKAAGIDGVVVVQVNVDEQGNVTEATAVSGPVQLRDAAVRAAQQAKFSPTLLSGEPMKVVGVLVYNFGRPQG
jgi:TonB family protein